MTGNNSEEPMGDFLSASMSVAFHQKKEAKKKMQDAPRRYNLSDTGPAATYVYDFLFDRLVRQSTPRSQ